MENNNIKNLITIQDEIFLDTYNWKEYIISDLFEVDIAKSVDKSKVKESKYGINYITRKSTNNGLEYKVENIENYKNKGKCITISMVGANKGCCFYQEEDFLSSQNMLILRNFNITKNIALFLINCLEKVYRISSDYNAIKKSDTFKNKIILPSKINSTTQQYIPDWDFMESYIYNLEKILNIELIKNKINNIKNIEEKTIDITEWIDYKLNDLFHIKGTKTTPKEELEKKGIGDYPYITTTALDQGVSGFYNFFTEQGNVLTFDSAVLGTCFYQEKNFSASDHVEVGIPKFDSFNKKIGIFLQVIINKVNEGIYHYGHKANQQRIRETVIKLPSKLNILTNLYEPDWEYIELYIDKLQNEINK